MNKKIVLFVVLLSAFLFAILYNQKLNDSTVISNYKYEENWSDRSKYPNNGQIKLSVIKNEGSEVTVALQNNSQHNIYYSQDCGGNDVDVFELKNKILYRVEGEPVVCQALSSQLTVKAGETEPMTWKPPKGVQVSSPIRFEIGYSIGESEQTYLAKTEFIEY